MREWLRSDPSRIITLLVAPGGNERVRKLVDEARDAGIAIETVPKQRLQAMAGPRNAQGVAARVPICRVNSLLRCVQGLQERGFWAVASVVGAHPAPSEHDMKGPVVRMVGSEGKGLRPSLRKAADGKTSVPSLGPASLNVSAFTSILLYEAARQRG